MLNLIKQLQKHAKIGASTGVIIASIGILISVATLIVTIVNTSTIKNRFFISISTKERW